MAAKVKFAVELKDGTRPEVDGYLVAPGLGVHKALAPDGTVAGTVTNLALPCSISLAAIALTMPSATLDIRTAGDNPAVTLAGGVSASFGAGAPNVNGRADLIIDTVRVTEETRPLRRVPPNDAVPVRARRRPR